MTNDTNKKQILPVEKVKRYYYFQFKQDFYQQEEILTLKTAAEENGDNPNDYFIFWLKLVAKSLSTRGFIRKANYDVLNEGFFKSILDFETSGTAKETITLVSRIIRVLVEKKLIVFLDQRRAIKIPLVEKMTMNKKEESERIRLWRLEHASLEKQYEATLDKSKIDPEDEFEIYFNKTFSGLIYYGYALEKDRDSYKAMLKLLYEDNQNLDLATEDFIKSRIPTISLNVVADKLAYLEATLKAYLNERQDMYNHIKTTKSKLQTQEGIDELIEIVNYDWIHQ